MKKIIGFLLVATGALAFTYLGMPFWISLIIFDIPGFILFFS